LLAACGPQYNYQSPHELIVQKCTEYGYKDKEFDDCVSSARKAYNEEITRQEKEYAKQQKEIKKRRLEADSTKCKDYGFKKGTKDFASCMMQIELSRKQEQQQHALVAQQIEANRRIATSQMLQNYFLQQQAIQEQRNIATQNQMNMMMNNNINCSSYRTGNYTRTNCW